MLYKIFQLFPNISFGAKIKLSKIRKFEQNACICITVHTWLSVVVTPPPVTTVAAERAATGEAEADVVGVVPLRGFEAVRVASFTSWNFSMN